MNHTWIRLTFTNTIYCEITILNKLLPTVCLLEWIWQRFKLYK